MGTRISSSQQSGMLPSSKLSMMGRLCAAHCVAKERLLQRLVSPSPQMARTETWYWLAASSPGSRIEVSVVESVLALSASARL